MPKVMKVGATRFRPNNKGGVSVSCCIPGLGDLLFRLNPSGGQKIDLEFARIVLGPLHKDVSRAVMGCAGLLKAN